MLIFDIETDGLYDTCTQIHCLVIYDTQTKQTLTYSDDGHTEPIVRGVQRLEDADCIIGHNVIGYDLPVIKKFYPWLNPSGFVLDTLLLSRLIYPDLLKTDQKTKPHLLPSQLYGSHSLEAHGYRIGEYKSEFSKHTDWKEFSPEMEAYCQTDVKVTTQLCRHFATHLSGLS